MAWYKSNLTGKIYSSEDVESVYNSAKKNQPRLIPRNFIARFVNGNELFTLDSSCVIDELVKANRLEDAAQEWQRQKGWTREQSMNVTCMMAKAMGVI